MNGGQLIKGHVPMGDVHQAFRPFQPMTEHWFSPRLQHHRDMQIFLPHLRVDGSEYLEDLYSRFTRFRKLKMKI